MTTVLNPSLLTLQGAKCNVVPYNSTAVPSGTKKAITSLELKSYFQLPVPYLIKEPYPL